MLQKYRIKILVVLLLVLVGIKFSFEPIVIDGSSMYPTFETGDHIVGFRIPVLLGLVKKQDIVSIDRPETGEVLVKRISEIQNNEYWVLGDNIGYSEDSRDFGWIPRSRVRSIIYKMSK